MERDNCRRVSEPVCGQDAVDVGLKRPAQSTSHVGYRPNIFGWHLGSVYLSVLFLGPILKAGPQWGGGVPLLGQTCTLLKGLLLCLFVHVFVCAGQEIVSNTAPEPHSEIPQLWNMRGLSRIRLENGKIVDMETGPLHFIQCPHRHTGNEDWKHLFDLSH